MSDPLFTVIVPTRNRPELLGSCLESLARQRYPAARFEVVVVDDGSPHPVTDVVLGYRERLRVSAHRQPNGGPAAACNAGAGVARGTYLAFIDDDCEAAPDWLATYEQAFRGDGRPVLLGGWTLNPDPGRLLPEISQLILRTMRLRYRPERGGIYFFGAANIAVRADEFHRIGGFDTSFTTAEDRELCDRWLHQGGMLTDVPGASVSRYEIAPHGVSRGTSRWSTGTHSRGVRFWNFTASHPAAFAASMRRFAIVTSPLWLIPISATTKTR